jgi:hypothetical protein
MKNYAIGKDEIIEFPLNPYGEGSSSAYSLAGKKAIESEALALKLYWKSFLYMIHFF